MKIVSPVSQRLVEATPVDFNADAEPWETFTLEDGTVVKMRLTPQSIMRLEGEFDGGGNPVYVFQTATVIRVVKAKIHGEPTTPVAQSAAKDGEAAGYA